MKRTLFVSLVSAGAFLFAQAAMAQGMPGQTPSTFPGRTTPGQTPGVNGPMGNTPTTTQSKVDDKRFAKDAVLDGMTEVELGKLASEKASRDDIKQFGQKVVDDHTKATDQLKQVATQENITIPDALDSKHQSRIDKLSKLSGEEFDKAFVKEQLKEQEAEVRDFNAEAQGGADSNIKTVASNILPALQQDLETVKNLNKAEKTTKQAKQ